MKTLKTIGLAFFLPCLLLVLAGPAYAVHVQCPGDVTGDGVSDDANIVCVHLAAGDGYAAMADGSPIYTFGFTNVTGVPETEVMSMGMLGAEFPAPTISVQEGQELYINLTNVGFVVRPDLFDPHSVHFHGFVNASSVFDGEPMASFGVNMGGTFTYFYKPVDPGTYMYHCHVEATEHMQMGMLGNIYVRPAQDGTPFVFGGRTYTKFAYNDGDGSTGYDVDYPVQIHAFDPAFHEQDETIQPLNFADLFDRYGMLNGRGYPDTVNPNPIVNVNGTPSQKVSTLITATQGQRVLLRVSNLSFDFYTLTSTIPMTVVGKDAKVLREADGTKLYYRANSIEIGGGQSADVILDTAGLPRGTYFLYTTNLQHLTNDAEERGGMMTEIVVN